MRRTLLFVCILLSVLSTQAQPIQLPNGGFENWNLTNDTPVNWYIHDYGEVTRTTDKHSGVYAVRLVSKYDNLGNVMWASVTLGTNSLLTGMPFTNMTDTLTGYYKYLTTGSDAGSIYFEVQKGGWSIGNGSNYKFTPTAIYKYFEIPIAVNDTPDHLYLEFFSSDYNSPPFTDGSELFLDDLQLKNSPTSISNAIATTNKVVVYPNPAVGTLYIRQTGKNIEASEVSIYNFLGEIVYSNRYEQSLLNTISVPVGDFALGFYLYRVRVGEEIMTGTFIKE